MHLETCKHPQIILRNGQYIHVPCRKCSACVNNIKYHLVNLLKLETDKHPFAIFFTLTYRDNCLTFIDNPDPDCPPIPVVQKYDIQLFLKRLRKNISNLVSDLSEDWLASAFHHRLYDKEQIVELYNKTSAIHEKSKIRYFITSEYTPENKRPHYHGILFIDSPYVAEKIYPLLCKSWGFGFVRCRPCDDEGFKYTAKYINSSNCVPNFDTSRFPELSKFKKNFRLSSRFFGFNEGDTENMEKVRELLFDGVTDLTCERDGKVLSIPLWSTLENRLFPKFSGVDPLDTAALYQSVVERNSATYLKRFSQKLVKSASYSLDELNKLYAAEQREYYKAQKIVKNARLNGLSIIKYCELISTYYDNKDRVKLKAWYTFQENFSEFHDFRYLINCYDNFRYNYHHDIQTASAQLMSFGQMSVTDYQETFVYKKFSEYENFMSLNDKIAHDDGKSKYTNDVLGLI